MSSTAKGAARRKPLAACVAVIFALSAPAALANTVAVSNCNDAGAGSLRVAVQNAGEGDTVDMSGLPGLGCSTISLRTGAITINQNNLTLRGPSSGVTITGKYNATIEQDRILNHQGSGTLNVWNLSIEHGNLYSTTTNLQGGGIYSKGSVDLSESAVLNCKATAKGAGATGGGIYVLGNLTTADSTIAGNSAISSQSVGGGIYLRGNFNSFRDTISGNSVTSPTGLSTNCVGGGIFARGSVDIIASTVSGNTSCGNDGGIAILGPAFGTATHSATILSSTISGNSAGYITGGMYSAIATTFRNSTIAFNTAGAGKANMRYYAPGVALGSGFGSFTAEFQSTLISDNTYGSTENDFSVANPNSHTVTVTGAANLIRVATGPVPVGTIYSQCPLLGPLRDNGGPTETHALLSKSPAIDAGNDTGFAGNYDQRGSPFLRVDNGTADIGAYEVQQGDIIFSNEFEGCP
jgi:hypothetical protein